MAPLSDRPGSRTAGFHRWSEPIQPGWSFVGKIIRRGRLRATETRWATICAATPGFEGQAPNKRASSHGENRR